MKDQLENIAEYIRTSFWFVPVLMSMVSIAVAVGMLHLDERYGEGSLRDTLLSVGGAENARSILTIIGTSIITVAGVVFSITIVALSLSAQEFGPRLLRTFKKDPQTQFSIGIFISTFIYCLLVLRSVVSDEPDGFVPNLSVMLAIFLAIASVLIFVLYIHHISEMIQVDMLIDRVHQEMNESMAKLFPEELGEGADQEGTEVPVADHDHQQKVHPERAGYIQALENDNLWGLAKKHDLLIEMQYRPGQFVVTSKPVMIVHSANRIPEKLRKKLMSTVILAAYRTPEQDIELSIDELVQIALRALSPSLNDPFTAMTCIDHLCQILCTLTVRKFPATQRHDETGKLRLINRAPITYADIIQSSFGRIRYSARSNAPVLERLLWALNELIALAQREDRRRIILEHAQKIGNACQESIEEPSEREELLNKFPALRLDPARN